MLEQIRGNDLLPTKLLRETMLKEGWESPSGEEKPVVPHSKPRGKGTSGAGQQCGPRSLRRRGELWADGRKSFSKGFRALMGWQERRQQARHAALLRRALEGTAPTRRPPCRGERASVPREGGGQRPGLLGTDPKSLDFPGAAVAPGEGELPIIEMVRTLQIL